MERYISLYHANEVNYTRMHLVDALPNVTHLSLLSSLVDNAADEDTASITSLIQSSAENAVRLLQTTNGDSVIFDPNTISETAAQTVNFVAEIAKHTLSTIFPLHKIITIIVTILVIVVAIVILILIIRYMLKRKDRRIGKRVFKHLEQILNRDENTHIYI